MPVFVELKKIRGIEPFGVFNWREVQINRRLREENPTIVDIVEAHEQEHEKAYRKSGVNAQDDIYFEPRAHLAALRQATSGRKLSDLHAKTKMGADVIKDLIAIDAEYQRRCQECNLPPTYEADTNTKSIMTHVLWDMRKRSEEERKRIIMSKLIKAFAGTIILAVAGFYISMGAVYAPGNQNSSSIPLSSYSTPEATLARSSNTPRVTAQFSQTPTIIFQNNHCVPVTGNFDQSISAWKTRNPGREPYYYGEVNQIGEKGTPCR